MTSSKITNQCINLFTNPKSNVDSTSKSNGTSSNFTSVMDKSLKSKQAVSEKDAYSDKKDVKNPAKKDVAKTDETENVVNTNTTYKKDIKNVSNEDVEKSATDTKESDGILNETVLDEVKELFSTTQNALTKGLNLTKEELEKQLELLGFTMFDMLNLDNLKQLILSVNGTGDITDALTNETLAKTLQDLTYEVEEIVQENQLNLTTDKLNEVFNQMMDKAINDNLDLEMVDDNGTDVEKDVKVPEVQVIVENDGANNSTDYSKSSKEDGKATEKSNINLDTIINNLSGINNNNTLSFSEGITKTIEIREIVNQIVDKIKILIKPDQTSMELSLNPEHLGKLQLSVVSKEGVLTAHFTASNETVKEALESQMAFLKENLINQGLKVDTIEVTVSNFEFKGSNEAQSDNNQGNSKKRRFLYDDVTDEKIVNDESVVMNEINELNGTTVDYSA